MNKQSYIIEFLIKNNRKCSDVNPEYLLGKNISILYPDGPEIRWQVYHDGEYYRLRNATWVSGKSENPPALDFTYLFLYPFNSKTLSILS